MQCLPAHSCRRRRFGALGWGLAIALLQPLHADASPPATQTAPASPAAKALAPTIDAIIDDSKLKQTEVGVAVVEVATGQVLYSRNADRGLNPASNAKLVTTATALAVLGPEYRFATKFYAPAGAWRGSELRGDLYIRGTGDPALVTEDLYRIARDLHARGLRKITGTVVVDSSYFDADGFPPGFEQKDEFASYRAPGGATSVNFNTHVVYMRPGATVGAPAVATVEPPVPCVVLENSVTTAAGRKAPVQAESEVRGGKLHIQFTGTIGVDAGVASYRYPIHDPSQYAGEAFVAALRDAGIKVQGKKVGKGKVPAAADLVSTHRSQTLGTLIRGVNKHSNNFMAEQVLKSLAPEPATADAALDVVRTHLSSLGINGSGLAVGNGSGLYDTNRVSASQLAQLLRAAYRDPRYASDFVASLPIAGADGTLRRRMRGDGTKRRVRAKTGTLNHVSALSGYAFLPDGRVLAFSILMNGFPKWQVGIARRTQNQIVEGIFSTLAPSP